MPPQIERVRALFADFLRRLWAWMRLHPFLTALGPPLMVLAYVLAVLPFTPSIADLRKAKAEVPSTVMSSDGVVLAQFRRLNRQWVPLSKVSPHVIDALIATEDHRFYQHHGLDVRRTASAILNTLRGK